MNFSEIFRKNRKKIKKNNGKVRFLKKPQEGSFFYKKHVFWPVFALFLRFFEFCEKLTLTISAILCKSEVQMDRQLLAKTACPVNIWKSHFFYKKHQK